jgi:hypothetical protein
MLQVSKLLMEYGTEKLNKIAITLSKLAVEARFYWNKNDRLTIVSPKACPTSVSRAGGVA